MVNPDELKAHEEMWGHFTKLVTYSSIAIFATLALMAVFLT